MNNKKLDSLGLGIGSICFFILTIVMTVNVSAQQVTTPSGTRTMLQEGIADQRGTSINVDISYNVSWEAKYCNQPRDRPQGVAWIATFSIVGVEYRDEYIAAEEIGQDNLKRGIEIGFLNSGIVAKLTNKENGESYVLDSWGENIVTAKPVKEEVCTLGAAFFVPLNRSGFFSRNNYTISIGNTDKNRSNYLKISDDLYINIALLTVNKKMSKAEDSAQRGNIDEARRIAMTARSVCPHPKGHGYTFGPTDDPTTCQSETSNFMRQLNN